MADTNAFQDAAGLYQYYKQLNKSYEAAAPIARLPELAAQVAKDSGEDTAAKYLLDPKVPDYLKMPFVEAQMVKIKRQTDDYVKGNLEKILEDAPDSVVLNALTKVHPNEKQRILIEHYQSKYDDKKPEEKLIKQALLNLYLNTPKALEQRFIQLVAEQQKDKKGLVKYVSGMLQSDEDKIAFFEGLFEKPKNGNDEEE